MASKGWISVSAGVIFKEGCVLLARRKSGKDLSGFWEFPGGKLEAGETPEACLEREISEELGISISNLRFWMESRHQYPSQSILLKVVTARYEKGEITLVDHDAYAWVKKEEIDGYRVSPADVPVIKQLKQISWDAFVL